MNDPKVRREYSTGEVGEIVRIALERQGSEGRISHDELLETAREIGVTAEDIEEAVAEEARIREARAAIEARRKLAQQWFVADLVAYVVINGAIVIVDRAVSGGRWFVFPLIIWGIVLAIHAVFMVFAKQGDEAQRLEETRGRSRARIDAAFGAATSSPGARRPRAGRSVPPLPPDDDGDSASPAVRDRERD
jgi:2TM domain